MSSYKELTSKVSTTTFQIKETEIDNKVNAKIDEVNAAVDNIPDVKATADESAILMAITLG